jgi:hypothetical protein
VPPAEPAGSAATPRWRWPARPSCAVLILRSLNRPARQYRYCLSPPGPGHARLAGPSRSAAAPARRYRRCSSSDPRRSVRTSPRRGPSSGSARTMHTPAVPPVEMGLAEMRAVMARPLLLVNLICLLVRSYEPAEAGLRLGYLEQDVRRTLAQHPFRQSAISSRVSAVRSRQPAWRPRPRDDRWIVGTPLGGFLPGVCKIFAPVPTPAMGCVGPQIGSESDLRVTDR